MPELPKTIIICSTSLHEYDRRLQRISGSLSDAGYKVVWISRTKNEAEQQQNEKKVKHLILQTTFKSGPLFYLEFNWRVRKLVKSISADIVCAVDLDTIMGTSWATDIGNTSLIFDAHEIYYEVPELIGKPLKKAIWQWVARKYLPHLKAAYTVNHSLKLHYQKYGLQYEVIRNVPPIRESKTLLPPVPRQNNKVLVYLGVLNAGRGLEIYMAAMTKLPEYRLLIIGEGDLSEELRAKAGNDPAITFTGYLKPTEIFEALSHAAIGLNLLKAESLNYKLSLANKFFDYMHAGLPSINMAYPEYQQIINEHPVGTMLESYDTIDFVNAVTALEDKALYSQLSTTALKAIDLYNWEREEQKLLAFYEQL